MTAFYFVLFMAKGHNANLKGLLLDKRWDNENIKTHTYMQQID